MYSMAMSQLPAHVHFTLFLSLLFDFDFLKLRKGQKLNVEHKGWLITKIGKSLSKELDAKDFSSFKPGTSAVTSCGD